MSHFSTRNSEPTATDMHRAARQGVDWILAQQHENGAFCDPDDGIGSYYKIPRTLAIAGELRAARRLLQWVADNHISDTGDFRAPERKAHEPIHETWPVYANAWLILGAQSVGRWDMARKGMSYLSSLETMPGGYYTLDGGTKYLEPVALSWGGFAALVTGDHAASVGAGNLLANLIEAQPDPSRFYYRMDVAGTLITDVPPGRDLDYLVDANKSKQIYYNPGIALIFLCHLYRATGTLRYLDAANTILRFTERCADDIHRFPPSGKLGLGCALLYDLTRDPIAKQAVRNVGAYLIETQTPNGYWRLPDEEPYSSLANRDSYDVLLDITAEFSVFLLEMASLV